MNIYLSTIRATVKAFPAVVPHLKGRARWFAVGVVKPRETFDNPIYSNIRFWISRNDIDNFIQGVEVKTADYMLRQIEGLVRSVYNNDLGGDFIDVMANLISGQLTQAYTQAWTDEGNEGELPDYLTAPLEDAILNQYDYVDQFYRDIVDARIDETPIDPLLSRAAMWAAQWDAAYRRAVELMNIEGGGNLVWVKGQTEKGCTTCANLDGIVMSAKEWEELGVHPRGYPNKKLECEGGGPANNCDCTLEPTDQRRTAGAYGKVEEIIL